MTSLIFWMKFYLFCLAILCFQIKKTKNVSHDAFGSKLGRIHMESQDLSRVRMRKLKGLKKSAPTDADEEDDGTKRQRLEESSAEEMDAE